MKFEISKKSISNLFSETHCDPPFTPKLWSGTFSKYEKTKIIAVISTPKSGLDLCNKCYKQSYKYSI